VKSNICLGSPFSQIPPLFSVLDGFNFRFNCFAFLPFPNSTIGHCQLGVIGDLKLLEAMREQSEDLFFHALSMSLTNFIK